MSGDPRSDAFRRSWTPDAEQVPDSFFESLFQRFEDPWALAERWSETRKRQLTLAMLPRARYDAGLEVGCAGGLLTERLAERCRRLLAVDVAPGAVRQTAARMAGTAGVEVLRMAPPDQWPEGDFDLVVLSEVLYFSAGERLEHFITGAVERMRPGGHLLAVHYRPATDIHLVDGDTVHRRLRAAGGLRTLIHHSEPEVVLDVLEREAP